MNEKYHDFKPTISEKIKIAGNKSNINIGAFTIIEDYVLLDVGTHFDSHILIGKRCKIKQGAILRTYNGTIKLGDRVSIGEYTLIAGHGGITIGNCTIIAGHCYMSAAGHLFMDGEIMRFQGETTKGINIGNNVWIGGNVMIVDGVSIADGCVIGAGSVVTDNLQPNTICCGNPCKEIKEREKPYWLFENTLGGK